ncbi:unnamed protein product [Coregonus sp. 'balchen']|nr:unnamed protein product [Coregonus sp. 'balchen']
MSASAIFILDLKGKVLISRNYMGNMDMNEVDHFMPIMMRMEEDADTSPLVTHGSSHFLWIKHRNLYLVAMTKKNANAALVYSFLYKIVEVFKEYFKELEEESIRDNFVTVYELMDEVMDFGFPQTTDSKILQEYITQQGHKLDVGAPRPPATVTNAVSWRSEGIKYRKNEVFMDVIESVSATGSVLRSEIVGSIKLKVVLSGMPELRLGLNDKVLFEITGREKSKTVELEDVKFHQCARSQFKSRSTANNVAIMVPVPSDADSPKFKTSTGSCQYLPEKSVGGKEYMMRAHFGLPSVESTELEGRRPITVNFEIPYFTVSGIQIINSGQTKGKPAARRIDRHSLPLSGSLGVRDSRGQGNGNNFHHCQFSKEKVAILHTLQRTFKTPFPFRTVTFDLCFVTSSGETC